MAPPLLDVRDLRVEFDTDDGVVHAVDGISYSVDRGRALGIVGESGSGKSVSNLTVMGLTRFYGARVSGEVVFDGRDLLTLGDDEMRRIRGDEIAMIFQDPLSSLHPFYKIGRQLQHELDTAVVTITHDLGVIAETVDEVAVMYAGRIVERAGTARIFQASEHPYTWGLLRSIPRLDVPRDVPLVPIPGTP